MEHRVSGFERPSPVTVSTGLLTPGKSIKLIARSTFVLSVGRTIEPNARTEGKPFYRISGGTGDSRLRLEIVTILCKRR
jgi:hypothetical protein